VPPGRLANALRTVDSNGSWCIEPSAIALPCLRASVSSPSTTSASLGGSQRSASRKTSSPTWSSCHAVRLKKRWNPEMCRQPRSPPVPTTPAARATAVTVWRPTQCSQPATREQHTRYVGAVKHGANAAAMGMNVSGSMSGGMASSNAAGLWR
jgi:hypothetical protein